MNKEDEVALEASISDWKKRANGSHLLKKECPLCTLGKKREANNISILPPNKCTKCIIKKHTGKSQCCGTPYWRTERNTDYYQREIEFLESLRPEKKVKDIIEVGDKVTLYDNSYLFRLHNGKIGDRYDKNLNSGYNKGDDNNVYIILEVSLSLPEGSDNRGQYGNDTIIYNPEDGSYIFTRKRFLKLVEPKHCSECGKAK